ncbi:MAG: hypothetical protein U0T69_08665 [Chitinophagales bacterium]
MTEIINKYLVIAVTLLALISCDTENINSQQSTRKIVQSNLVHEDNVNGRIASGGNIIESNNFVYNSNGLLKTVTVYDDTTFGANLIKQVEFVYYPEKVRAYTFNVFDTANRNYVYDLYFNTQKQVVKLIDTLGNGLQITYAGDKITHIKDSTAIRILDFQNFVYDGNNLRQYELSINGGTPIGKAELEYSAKTIVDELDTRFFSKDIKFIYIGGLNLITKVGLNFGINNSNELRKRTETNLILNQIVDTYFFKYEYNANNLSEIIKRSISRTSSPDTLYYQFRY